VILLVLGWRGGGTAVVLRRHRHDWSRGGGREGEVNFVSAGETGRVWRICRRRQGVLCA
jgi:hypothetical protein